MTNREIRQAIEIIGANCIHALTVLASRLEVLDDVAEDDIQIIQDAAKDVAGVLTNLKDDFCDDNPADLGQFPPHLVTSLIAHGWMKRRE